MKYNNRYYPHPVLGIKDDVSGIFQCQLSIEVEKFKTILIPKCKLENTDLEDLIRDGLANFCMQIYCRGTMYREVFVIQDQLINKINLPSEKLNGETEVDFFLCAETDIEKYKNSANHEDFEDYSFSIEKGAILAYGGKGIFYANKSPEELKSISSIMNIKNSGQKNGPFYNEYDGPKITVCISETDYDNYQMLKLYQPFIPIIHSSLVFPALYEAVVFMEYDEAASQFQDYPWHKLIKERLENAKGGTLLEKVQNILDLPINRTLIELEELFED